jgi:hypothetical protein
VACDILLVTIIAFISTMFLLAFSCDNYSIYFNNVFVSFFLLFEWYEYIFCDTLRKIQLFVICIKIDLLSTIVGQ